MVSKFVIETAKTGSVLGPFGSGASVGSEVSELLVLWLMRGSPTWALEDTSLSLEGQ